MSKDEKLLQQLFRLFDPLVRDEYTVRGINSKADRTTIFFANGVSVYLKRSEFTVAFPEGRFESVAPLKRMERRRTGDGSYAWWLRDKMKRVVAVIGLSQPTDTLPVFVSHMREALVGSRVQSVSTSDGGLCLHLDDDYDAVMNGALRVRIHPERVPFTVSDVFVNRGGAGFVLCVCAQASEEDKNANKPVVAFKIDQDTLDRKELSFNVI